MRHAQRMLELQKWREQCNDEQGIRKNDAKQFTTKDEIISDDRTVDTMNAGVFGYDILLKQNIKESNRFIVRYRVLFKTQILKSLQLRLRFDLISSNIHT